MGIIQLGILTGFSIVAFGLLGYLTPKFTVFGGIATVGIWSIAQAMGISTEPGLFHVLGLLVDLWFLFPDLAMKLISMGGATETVVGSIVFVILGIPYVLGLYYGLIYWPEAVLLRLFF